MDVSIKNVRMKFNCLNKNISIKLNNCPKLKFKWVNNSLKKSLWKMLKILKKTKEVNRKLNALIEIYNKIAEWIN